MIIEYDSWSFKGKLARNPTNLQFVGSSLELLEEVEDKTRDVKFNDGWNDYLVEIVETEATKDVILL